MLCWRNLRIWSLLWWCDGDVCTMVSDCVPHVFPYYLHVCPSNPILLTRAAAPPHQDGWYTTPHFISYLSDIDTNKIAPKQRSESQFARKTAEKKQRWINQPVTLSGWLIISDVSKKMKWRRRFCTLRGARLSYSPKEEFDEQSTKSLTVINT